MSQSAEVDTEKQMRYESAQQQQFTT